MKCPEIQEIQDIKNFQLYLFPRLRDANLPLQTTDIFTPQMEEAVRELQGQFGVSERNGEIGSDTYEWLMKIKDAKPRPPQQPPATQPQTPAPQQPTTTTTTTKTTKIMPLTKDTNW